MIGFLHRVFISDATRFGDSNHMSLVPNVWVRPFNEMSDKSFGMSRCDMPGNECSRTSAEWTPFRAHSRMDWIVQYPFSLRKTNQIHCARVVCEEPHNLIVSRRSFCIFSRIDVLFHKLGSFTFPIADRVRNCRVPDIRKESCVR
jgi:hypothetical protein